MSCCSETGRWMSANRMNLNQHSRRRRCLSADRRLVGFCPITGGSCHKYHFCRDKHVFIATKHAVFVATKLYLSRQIIFVSTNPLTLSHTFVATKDVFYRDKIVLSRQAYFCRDKRRVLSSQNVCRDKK